MDTELEFLHEFLRDEGVALMETLESEEVDRILSSLTANVQEALRLLHCIDRSLRLVQKSLEKMSTE